MVTTGMGVIIMFLIQEKTGAIKLNTSAVLQLTGIVSELTTTVALTTQTSVVNTQALSGLEKRVRNLEIDRPGS